MTGTSGFDLILRHGTVMDGTGSAAVVTDIGIRDGRIAAIGDLDAATAELERDVTGRVVSPGFIDVHAHTDQAPFLADGNDHIKLASIRQGVTTEVPGNCGFCPFPVAAAPEASDPPTNHFRGFTTLAGYRAALAEIPLAVNLAPLAGHHSLRGTVVGYDDRAPTAEELGEMRRLLRGAMDDGAFGFSTGLVYAPGRFATTEEVAELAREAAHAGRPYVTHMRDEADEVDVAVAEALQIGRTSGAAVQISHHKVALEHNWGRSEITLAMIEAARGGGQDVTIDVYPYTAGSTGLVNVLPVAALEGGPDAIRERLQDGEARRRLAEELSGGPRYRSGWSDIVLASADGHEDEQGRSIAEIVAATGRDPVDYVCDVLLDDPWAIMLAHGMDPDEVATIGSRPYAMVGSDGIPMPGHQHPRISGTFARVLGAAARDRDGRDLPDLIRRMTSLPAQKFAIPDRGVLARGKVADVVVFDPATVADRATYEDPWQPPVGIELVLLAGTAVVLDGRDTGHAGGRVLEPAS
ncbi:MAG TPA: D-aminoacylase [Nitriliruptorales bacterium]